MTTSLNEFYASLGKKKLRPIYLLASDTTLLQQEARDALRNAAVNSGYNERQTEFVEAGFDWVSFFNSQQNLSLFSDKTYIELHNPSTKFDDKGSKAIQSYLENPTQNKLLVILTAKLTTAQQKTRWYKAIEAKGVAINIRAVTKAELPNWINQRAKQAKLKLNRDSIQLLAELTEGNLLATHQALMKLRLLYPNQEIDPEKMLHVISDSARFNVFDLANLLLAGKTQAALRCLHGLKNTGTEPTLILWAICRELREVIKIAEQHQQGIPLQQLLQRQWQSRRALLQSALRRLPLNKLNHLLLLAEQSDRAIKGINADNQWDSLEKLIVASCHA